MLEHSWLVSSAGRRGELVRILKNSPLDGNRSRVVAVDVSPLSAAGQIADAFVTVPTVSDPSFVSSVLDFSKDQGVRALIPTIDPELAIYARNRDAFFDQGITPWVSSPSVCAIGGDKWQFNQFCEASGVATPRTAEVGTEEATLLVGPVIAKPRSGSAGIGIRRFANVIDALDANLPLDYIVQAASNGREVTIDFAVGTSGRLLGFCARERLEVRAGEVSKAVTISHPLIDDFLLAFVGNLRGAYGVLNLQVFFDEATGSVEALELNPRFGGGYPLSHYAGCNLIEAVVRDSRGEHRDLAEGRPGTVMLRYDTQVILSSYGVGKI